MVEANLSEVKVSYTFDAGTDRLFAAWTEPELIQTWVPGIEHSTSMTAAVELQVGGRYCYKMQIEDFGEVVMIGTYTEIDMPKRIAYTLNWEPIEGLDSVPDTAVTVDFTKRRKQTEVHLTHSGLSSEMIASVTAGWQAAFDRLANIIRPSAVPSPGSVSTNGFVQSELYQLESRIEQRLDSKFHAAKAEILSHFDVVAENIHRDVAGTNKDEISSLKDHQLPDHEARLQRLEKHAGLPAGPLNRRA